MPRPTKRITGRFPSSRSPAAVSSRDWCSYAEKIGSYLRCVLAVLLCLLFVGGGATGAAYGAVSTKTFSSKAFTITFRYPSAWTSGQARAYKAAAGATAAQVEMGLDSISHVFVSRINLTFNASAANLARAERYANSQIKQDYGRALPGKRKVFGGLTGFVYPTEKIAGQEITDQETVVFNGSADYFIVCQSSAANQATMNAGRATILNSIRPG